MLKTIDFHHLYIRGVIENQLKKFTPFRQTCKQTDTSTLREMVFFVI